MAKSKKEKVSKVLREFSSGGVVFKDKKYLVRSTKPSKEFPKKYWTLPKGWLDDLKEGVPGPKASGEEKANEKDLEETALREVGEEGGVEAKIIKKIGTIKFFYVHPERGNVLKFVTFFLMEWQRDLPAGHDGETTEVEWLDFDSALKKLSFSTEKEVLRKAKIIFDSINS